MSRVFCQVVGLALCLGAVVCAFAQEEQPSAADSVDESTVDDVMVVTADPAEAEAPVLMNEIFNANGKGGWLYRNGRYKEAFPHLLSAAESGFKLAQARVSFIYQQGLGEVPRDAEAAIGWLGVAAAAPTTPEIRNYFQRVLDHYPTDYRPRIDEVVAEYRQRYGAAATRVDCENKRLAGTHISRLKCDFRDAPIYQDVLDAQDIPSFVPPVESGP